MWNVMMAGIQPFYIQDGKLCLDLSPALPGWLFDGDGKITFIFLGHTQITYHNPSKSDTWKIGGGSDRSVVLHLPNKEEIKLSHSIINSPYAEMVRTGRVDAIDVFL